MSHDQSQQTPADPGYETRDVSVPVVLWLGVGVAGVTVLACAILWLLLAVYMRRAERSDPERSPLASQRADPPASRLQETPLADYRDFRAREEHVLSTYGWVDKEKGTARIPIDRAMDLFVERGEAAVTASAAAEEDKKQ